MALNFLGLSYGFMGVRWYIHSILCKIQKKMKIDKNSHFYSIFFIYSFKMNSDVRYQNFLVSCQQILNQIKQGQNTEDIQKKCYEIA